MREFGARPLKRYIQKNIEDPLSIEILSGKFNENDIIIIDLIKNSDTTFKFIFKK